MSYYLPSWCALAALCLLLFLACQGEAPVETDTTANTYTLAETDLPDYESHLDHQALIKGWSPEFYHKGLVTYRTICYNCHGNEEQPGSLPQATKFWQDSLKMGADPYAMYQTLTRGIGLMPPQVRLSPQEKYEVIHFIREEFMKEQNPGQYFAVTDEWLAGLPAGDTLGPAPQPYQPWAEMDYGDFLMRTYELANTSDPGRGISGGRSPLPNEDFRNVNFAYKGIAMRLDAGTGGVAAGNTFALFDHDLMRFAGFWTGEGFIDYEDILLNDQHNIFPRTVGQIQVENPITPGWADPRTGSFADPRFVAVDGRPFGPLPQEWTHYKGLYYHGSRVVIRYTVGTAEVLETYDLESADGPPVISRTLNVTAPEQALSMRIAPADAAVHLYGDGTLQREGGFQLLQLPAGKSARSKILLAAAGTDLRQLKLKSEIPEDLSQYTRGGPTHYPQILSSPLVAGTTDAAYVEDVFVLPQTNPWKSRMRPSGIDFGKDPDEALVCTVDGEVWRLTGIQQAEGMVKWQRIASGLFQPLGIKYHKGAIYVSCRDQIAKLIDLNGDGETDYYESFNSDHQVTEHFHEFAMGLQVDKASNFYYAKSGRHARTALVPQHGTLIRVSPDGSQSEIIAHGFRAANGVCLNPDGSFIVTDQEGYWNPMNRINWVEAGGFYGNMYGYGAPADTSDAAMLQPLCWIDSKYDRSPAELLWADSDRWGPLSGQLLNLSYGYGKVFAVLPQKVGDIRQGAMTELPIAQFPTGIMRGRFHPTDGQLYVCGMSAWATNQMIQVGGLYRIRYTGKPILFPVQMSALQTGIRLQFTDKIHPEVTEHPERFKVSSWELKRSHNYGSKRYHVEQWPVKKVELSEDGRTVHLDVPDLRPNWVIEILYEVPDARKVPVEGAIQGTVYTLAPD